MDSSTQPRADQPRRSDGFTPVAGMFAVLLSMGAAVSSLQTTGPSNPVTNTPLP